MTINVPTRKVKAAVDIVLCSESKNFTVKERQLAQRLKWAYLASLWDNPPESSMIEPHVVSRDSSVSMPLSTIEAAFVGKWLYGENKDLKEAFPLFEIEHLEMDL